MYAGMTRSRAGGGASRRKPTFEQRPWGTIQYLARQDGHQVRHLHVEPQGQLSLHYHQQRSERWIVVQGQATVTLGEKTEVLSCGQVAEIPVGAVHRLENLTLAPLEVIEVQLGEDLGDEDVVRLEDEYHRV